MPSPTETSGAHGFRPTGVAVALRVSSLALVASGYLALVATPRFSTGMAAIPCVMFVLVPLGEWLDGRFAHYRRLWRWVSIGYLLFIPVSLLSLDLLGSVIALLVYIQAYSLLHRKEARDYFHLYLMAFFMLLAACVLRPEPVIALVLLLFLASAIAASMMLHLHVELARCNGAPAPDIVPLDGQGPFVLTASPRVLDAGLIGAVAAVAVLSVVVTAALFVVTPRMEAGFLGRSDPLLFASGRTDRPVSLAEGGYIVNDPRAVMRVTFPDEPGGRYNGPMFWRCTAFCEYKEGGWARREISGHQHEPAFALVKTLALMSVWGRGASEVSRVPLGERRVVHQAIYMDQVPSEGVPSLPLAQKVRLEANSRGAMLSWSRVDDFSVMLTGKHNRWLEYEAWSEVEEFAPRRLRSAPDDYASALDPGDYALLVHQDLEPRTVGLAERITADAATVYDKVTAIREYLNGGDFRYTRQLANLPSDHPVDAFVHETRAGHCELFASAMALMLRSLDIPARVVSGYRGGEWNDLDRSYTVRADMAHMWVEVFFIGIGWVTFDPSAAEAAPGLLSPTRLARLASQYTLRAKIMWYRDIVGFDRGIQVQVLRDLGFGLAGWGAGVFDPDNYLPRAGAPPIGRVPLALLLGAAVVLLVVLWRPSRRGTGRALLTDDQTRAVRLYRRLLRKLGRVGVACHGRTAEEIRDGLSEVAGLDARPLYEVFDAYNQARFGGKPLPPSELARLRRLIRRATAA